MLEGGDADDRIGYCTKVILKKIGRYERKMRKILFWKVLIIMVYESVLQLTISGILFFC